MTWLPYGVDKHGELVFISVTPRGRTDLTCPYCGRGLTAKRGEIKIEHFAHTGETCRAARRSADLLPTLPCYDNFNLHLNAKILEALHEFHTSQGPWRKSGRQWEQLLYLDLITYNGFSMRYDLTRKGKIPLGELSLALFNEEQENMLHKRHTELEKKAADVRARHPVLLDEALTDLRIYRAQYRRILEAMLYFLEIDADGQKLHKIGVTTRSITERVGEVEQDLQRRFHDVQVKIVDTWDNRGNVELYFKYRYRPYQSKIDALSEYFAFPDVKKVLRDLHRMKPKQLSGLEMEILSGQAAPIDRDIHLAHAKEQRIIAIKQGMQQAAAAGKHVGRPTGSAELQEEFLEKPSSKRVIEALNSGLSLRKAATHAGVSINTVRKVIAAKGSRMRDNLEGKEDQNRGGS